MAEWAKCLPENWLEFETSWYYPDISSKMFTSYSLLYLKDHRNRDFREFSYSEKKYSHIILSVLENHRTLISLHREFGIRSFCKSWRVSCIWFLKLVSIPPPAAVGKWTKNSLKLRQMNFPSTIILLPHARVHYAVYLGRVASRRKRIRAKGNCKITGVQRRARSVVCHVRTRCFRS